jgi:hypothetical protein
VGPKTNILRRFAHHANFPAGNLCAGTSLSNARVRGMQRQLPGRWTSCSRLFQQMERLGTDFGAGAPIGERVKTESECSPGHRRTQGRSRWAEIRRETRTQRIREQGTGEPAEEAVRLSHERIEAGERTTQTGVTLLQTGLEAVQRNIELTLGLIKDVSEHNIRDAQNYFGA